MIKILPLEKVREADQYTIDNEPIASINLMERAAHRLFNWFVKNIKTEKKIHIFCGTGNNGGDGLALARILFDKEYDVIVYLVGRDKQYSDNNETNLQRIKRIQDIPVKHINSTADMPACDSRDVIIDAIFGSGLTRPVEGIAAEVIKIINASKSLKISIDIPSGLYADRSNKDNTGAIVRADHTLSFQFPKLAFMFSDNYSYTGKWEVLSIDLHEDFIREVDTSYFLTEKQDMRAMIKGREKFAHKGNFGHALLIAGSYNKTGAAVLSAKACLRAGAGLLTTHIPESGRQVVLTAFPESLVEVDKDPDFFTGVANPEKYDAIGIGPGIDTREKTRQGLKKLIETCEKPLLLDADAINILGMHPEWIPLVPKHSVFTPHPKEFQRLAGASATDFDRLERQKSFSVEHQVYVVLKGAHTAISTPEGKVYFNNTGNPGMATAGAGDVLTGLILGLLSQGYKPFEACLLGVYLHGLTGDLVLQNQSWESLIASDLIEYLGMAFNTLK
jgi:NAD(P)H-hydrate epimerase